jgi:hypothetical protein
VKSFIIACILFISFQSYSQDTIRCSKYVTQSYDSITDESYSSAEILIPARGKAIGFAVLLFTGTYHDYVTCDIVCVSQSMVCLNYRNAMSFVFTDGSKLDIKSDGDFNCEGNSELHFGGAYEHKREYQIFKSREIQSIGIMTANGWVQNTLTAEQGRQIRFAFECLSDVLKRQEY